MGINKRADNNDRQWIYHICQSLLIILDNRRQDDRKIYICVNSTKKCQGSLLVNSIPEDESIRKKTML